MRFFDIDAQLVEKGRRMVGTLLSALDSNAYLCHHGVKGQKWGERNGPPYPLNQSEDGGRKGSEADLVKQKSSSLKKGIRKLRMQIEEHESKISNPAKHYPQWELFDEREKAGYIKHWQKEIRNFRKKIEARINE